MSRGLHECGSQSWTLVSCGFWQFERRRRRKSPPSRVRPSSGRVTSRARRSTPASLPWESEEKTSTKRGSPPRRGPAARGPRAPGPSSSRLAYRNPRPRALLPLDDDRRWALVSLLLRPTANPQGHFRFLGPEAGFLFLLSSRDRGVSRHPAVGSPLPSLNHVRPKLTGRRARVPGGIGGAECG